jgi:hypothetical protein
MPNQAISISVDANVGAASEQLSTFFNTLNYQIKNLPKASSAASEGLKQLRETSMVAREGFHGLSAMVVLLGGSHFPMLAEGVMASRMALMTLRSAALLTGASLATLAPELALIGVVVGAGVLAWRSYTSETEKAAKAQKDLMESMVKLPGLLGTVNELLKARRISAQAADEYEDYLTGRKKLYKNSEGEIVTTPTEHREADPGTWMPGPMGLGSFVGARPEGEYPISEASLGEAQEYMRKWFEGKGGIGDPSIQAINKLTDLEREQRNESLAGLQKEEAEIHTRYEKEREEIRKTIAEAKLSMTPKEKQAGEAALALSEKNEASAIVGARLKQEDEELEQAAKAAEEIAAEHALRVKEEHETLERQLSLTEAQEGVKRGQNYEREYQARVGLYKKELDAGEIVEKEYTRLVEDATIKRLEAKRQEAEEAVKIAEGEVEIELARLQGQRHLFEADPDATQAEKAQKLVVVLQQENDALEKGIAINRERVKDMSLTPEARLLASKQLAEQQQRQAQNQADMGKALGTGTFSGEFKKDLADLQNQWGNLATSLTGGAFRVIQQGVQGMANALTGLIMGTKSAGQAFAEFGTQLLTSFIEMILEAVIYAEVALPLLTALNVEMGGAPAAAGSGVTVAAVGGAIASVTAMAGASGMGFSEGGFTGTGQSGEIAGVVHRNEFVFSPPAVQRLGVGTLASLHEGALNGGGGGGATQNKINLAILNDQSDVPKWARSQDGEAHIVDVVRRNLHKLS